MLILHDVPMTNSANLAGGGPRSFLNLGVSSFPSAFHDVAESEINGLPRLPNSVSIVARLFELRGLRHPNLCHYLDGRRNKHERVIVVAEHFPRCLANATLTGDQIREAMFETLHAMAYLESQKVVHRNLCPTNILLDRFGHVKLSDFGLFYMTGCGTEVDFPIGKAAYTAPEVFIDRRSSLKRSADSPPLVNTVGLDPRCDVWSFGMVFLELLYGKSANPCHALFGIKEIISQLLKGLLSESSFVEFFGLDLSQSNLGDFDLHGVDEVVLRCLEFDVRLRPHSSVLVADPVFRGLSVDIEASVPVSPFNAVARIRLLARHTNGISLSTCNSAMDGSTYSSRSSELLASRSPEEVYCYWSLAGGDLEGLLREAHLAKSVPPILQLPHFIEVDGGVEYWPQARNRSSSSYDDTVVPLPADKLLERLNRICPDLFYPLLGFDDEDDEMETIMTPCNTRSLEKRSMSSASSISHQPVSVKEGDIEYQIGRTVLFSRLLTAYPMRFRRLWQEARQDIPPLLRGQVWAALLRVGHDFRERYAAMSCLPLDEKSANQIAVDLPRCHSYNELLVAPTGQAKMARVLRAWLLSHPDQEYTQGMDSLCAVFVRLHYTDEALAFACLEAFIAKFMHNIFSAGTEPLHEYYAVVQQLLSFHAARLASYLADMANLSLTGFTAGWIYTMFAHFLPIHKTMQLWDTLLLGDSSFPMFVFLAIIHQLNDRCDFESLCQEEIFTLFSNLPDINLDQCREDTFRFALLTPPSVTCRRHDSTPPNLTSGNPALAIHPLPLDRLVQAMAPRISVEDLLRLLDDAASGPVLLVDIRPAQEFAKGCLQGSVNFPATSILPVHTDNSLEFESPAAAGRLVPSRAFADVLKRSLKHIKVILSKTDDQEASRFADCLIREGVNHVCLLQGGIELLRRETDRLVIPSLPSN